MKYSFKKLKTKNYQPERMNSFSLAGKLKAEKGFSLIELLVAISLFAVVIAINTNMFIVVMKAQRKVIETQNLADSTRYVMETMTREIRTMNLQLTQDSSYCTDSSCLNESNDYSVAITTLAFVSGSENRSGFVMKMYHDNINETIKFDDDVKNSPGDEINITPPNIKVTNLNFKVNNLNAFSQPKITVLIEAESKNAVAVGSPESIILQSTISPRALNL